MTIRHEFTPRESSALEVDIKAILTPKVLRAIHDRQFPSPKNARIDWDRQCRRMFGELETNEGWKELCYDNVFVPISTIGIGNLPTDMLQFLPDPAEDDFPVLCLGFICLFDQGPGHVLSGTDMRYATQYFRPLALRLVHQCLQLPLHLHPWTWGRWRGLGWDFEHWVIRQILFFAPLTHSESIDNHATQYGIMEHMRALTEQRVGQMDPYRANAGGDAHDTTLFPSLIVGGPPTGPKVKMEDYVWFTVRVMHAHVPIIRKFGRYPYRNLWRGVDDTEEEKSWLEETKWYGVPKLSEEQKRKVKEEVEKGIWTPLKPSN